MEKCGSQQSKDAQMHFSVISLFSGGHLVSLGKAKCTLDPEFKIAGIIERILTTDAMCTRKGSS